MRIGNIRTIDDRFAIGYTVEDCIYRKDIRKFKKIDKDGDGILSDAEIIARRKKEVKNKNIWNIACIVAGCAMTIYGIKKKSTSLGVMGGGFCLPALHNMIKINSEKKKTEHYERELLKLNAEC